jgi:glutathione S-transferase
MPAGPLGRTRHLQMPAFLSSEVQKPFVRLFFSEREGEKEHLRETLARRLDWIGGRAEGRHLFGDRFTGADALLYVMLRWAEMLGMAVSADLSGLAARAEERDAVRATLAFEELEPLGQRTCAVDGQVSRASAALRRRCAWSSCHLIYVNSRRPRHS